VDVGKASPLNAGSSATSQQDRPARHPDLRWRRDAAFLGVTAPLDTTADTALTMRTDPADAGWVQRAWPEAAGMVGSRWWTLTCGPWCFRLRGPREHCYRWPYFFSRSPERVQASAALAEGYAALATASW